MRSLIIYLMLLASALATAGTPELAAQIESEYDAANLRWAQKLAGADAQAQLDVWKSRPQTAEFAARMWTEVKDSLKEDWTLDYCSWMLERSPVFVASTGRGEQKPRFEIMMHAIDRFHLKSARVGKLCLALTTQPDPRTLALVEKVSKESPHIQVQGQAALAIAMLLKGLGENDELIIRRIERLREAIIKAHDVKVGDLTVSKMAMDEIFIIQNLVKGRIAPDIIGRDSSGVPFKLSMMKGKVTVLAFWHSSMRDADRGLALLRKLHQDHGQNGMDLIGVTSDSLEVLRKLRTNGTIPWRNFSDVDRRINSDYRVRNLPLVYVLNDQRKILYIGGPGAFVDLMVTGQLAKD